MSDICEECKGSGEVLQDDGLETGIFIPCGVCGWVISDIEGIISDINHADEAEIMEYDFEPCFKVMRKVESLEADNALLTAKVEELQSLCMEFASMGRTTVNQNESLKHLCESYSEIANQRHLTTNRGKE